MASRKYDIVEKVAKERRVEGIIANVCRSDAPEMHDFAQMVYLALLEKDDALIERLWDKGQIDYYITGVVLKQWKTKHSAFRDLFGKWQRRAGDREPEAFGGADDDWWDKPKIERGG